MLLNNSFYHLPSSTCLDFHVNLPNTHTHTHRRRCDIAVEKYKELKKKTTVNIITLSGGTAHAPNYTDEAGFHVHEATASANYLVASGVENHMIYKEWASYGIFVSLFLSFSLTFGWILFCFCECDLGLI
jgi:hypothetical protein